MTLKIGYGDERFLVERNGDWADGKPWEVRDTATGKLMSRHKTAADAIIARDLYTKEREV